jgi:hypothetical protein
MASCILPCQPSTNYAILEVTIRNAFILSPFSSEYCDRRTPKGTIPGQWGRNQYNSIGDEWTGDFGNSDKNADDCDLVMGMAPKWLSGWSRKRETQEMRLENCDIEGGRRRGRGRRSHDGIE